MENWYIYYIKIIEESEENIITFGTISEDQTVKSSETHKIIFTNLNYEDVYFVRNESDLIVNFGDNLY